MVQNDSIYGTSAFDGTVKSDFLALGIVPENLRSEFIDYSTADFSEFKTSLLNYLKAVYPLDYTNFVESDLGIMLVELFSYLASVISLKSDLLANELYLPTVQTVGNLSKLLNLIGISMKGPIASKATVKATLSPPDSVATGQTITIPLASRSFSVPNSKDGGALFFTLYEVNTSTGEIDLDNPDIVLELNRLCCIDDTPTNTESYFIGQTFKWLKKNTKYKVIISFADTAQGHEGIIYKATNFIHSGMTTGAKALMVDGERYHQRMLTKKCPKGDEIRKRIKDKDENIWTELLPPKHIYVYYLDKRMKRKYN